jgi:uncharacterized Fe-S cluster protein YjdI
MGDTIKHYTKDGVTVVWQPHLCQHSTICWKGLNSVFDPLSQPWVNMDGATTGEIIAQVKACPSGALSYIADGPAAI